METIKKVACYYRVSSSGQKDRGTMENQRYACRELCAVNGWEIVAEFEDPAVSGTVPIDERPLGKKMIERVKAGDFDALVAVHLDRLTRSEKMQERGYIYDVFGENNTAFASPSEGVIHCNSLVGDVTFSLRSAIAKDEREKILERQQAGRYRASREGRYAAGQINYGMDTDEGEWVMNEAEVNTLREIRRLVKAGVSTAEMARIFNTDRDKYPPKYARRWTAANVGNKFQADFLFTGERPFKVGPDQRENHKIVDPPFFTKEEVMEVRHLLRQKKRGGPRRPNAERQASFLLAGIGYCGDCGGKLYIQDFTPQGKPYTYYRCKDCNMRIDRQKVDKATWKAYAKTVANPQALKQAVVEEDFITNKTKSDLIALRDGCAKRLEELEGELDRLNELYIRGKMREEQYNKLSDEFEAEQARVETNYRRAVNTLTLPDQRDEAIKRASKLVAHVVEYTWSLEIIAELKKGVEEIQQIAEEKGTEEAKLRALLAGLDTYEGIKELYRGYGQKMEELKRELAKSDRSDIIRERFRIVQKLLNDLVLAGGKITINHQGVVINGLIRLGEDDFKQEIIGQATFG